MKERLFDIIKRNELTAWRFAELLEVQPSSISHILSGRNKPSFDFIEKILTRFPEINPDWLILGQGEMIRVGYNDELEIREAESKQEPTLFDITSDNEGEYNVFTNVNNTNNKNIIDDNSTNITNVIADKPIEIVPKKEINSHIASLVTRDEVERVMVFYTNGTFSSYIPK